MTLAVAEMKTYEDGSEDEDEGWEQAGCDGELRRAVGRNQTDGQLSKGPGVHLSADEGGDVKKADCEAR